MGFSWSSFLAQTTLLGCCTRAGLRPSSLLSLDLPAPFDLRLTGALATDDVAIFTTRSKEVGDVAVARLDNAIAQRGVVPHRGKDVDFASDATVIGIDLCGGVALCPQLDKLTRVLAGVIFLLCHDAPITGDECAALNGQLAWLALLNRPLFSALFMVYDFARSDPSGRRRLPAAARAELWLFLCLLPWCMGDLTRVWQNHVVCSDASPSFGFGVSVARATKGIVREIARTAARPMTFVRLDRVAGCPDDEPERCRLGDRARVPLRKAAFRPVISSKAKHNAHAGTLEAEGVALALRWILRSTARHRRRTLLLVDAKAVLGAVARGRSSAPSLRRAVTRVAALCLGGDLLLHLVYVPSEDNPADAPSRGKRPARRSAASPVPASWQPRHDHLKRKVPRDPPAPRKWDRDVHQHNLLQHIVWSLVDAPPLDM